MFTVSIPDHQEHSDCCYEGSTEPSLPEDMFAAAKSGDIECVSTLLADGADAYVADSKGWHYLFFFFLF